MKKISIELFSGQGTVSSVAKSRGYQIISIDNNPKFHASMCCDILDIEKSDLPDCAHFLWASVPCPQFSRAGLHSNWKKTTIKYRQYKYEPLTPAALLSIQLLEKTIEILSWFPGVPFIIENPIGRLHHMPQMKQLGHYRYFVNYASFGHPFSKETYLFSNLQLPFPVKKYTVYSPGLRSVRNVVKRASIPRALVETIFNYLP